MRCSSVGFIHCDILELSFFLVLVSFPSYLQYGIGRKLTQKITLNSSTENLYLITTWWTSDFLDTHCQNTEMVTKRQLWRLASEDSTKIGFRVKVWRLQHHQICLAVWLPVNRAFQPLVPFYLGLCLQIWQLAVSVYRVISGRLSLTKILLVFLSKHQDILFASQNLECAHWEAVLSFPQLSLISKIVHKTWCPSL